MRQRAYVEILSMQGSLESKKEAQELLEPLECSPNFPSAKNWFPHTTARTVCIGDNNNNNNNTHLFSLLFTDKFKSVLFIKHMVNAS